MSAFPALALLSAHALAAWVRDETARARVTLAGFALIGAAGAVLALTPLGSPAPRRPDLQVVARSARSLVPASARIVFAGNNYYAIAHQFIFYIDRKLVQPPAEPPLVRAASAVSIFGVPAPAPFVVLF